MRVYQFRHIRVLVRPPPGGALPPAQPATFYNPAVRLDCDGLQCAVGGSRSAGEGRARAWQPSWAGLARGALLASREPDARRYRPGD